VHIVAGMAGKVNVPIVPRPGPHPYGEVTPLSRVSFTLNSDFTEARGHTSAERFCHYCIPNLSHYPGLDKHLDTRARSQDLTQIMNVQIWRVVDTEHHGYGVIAANSTHLEWEYRKNGGGLADRFVLTK
jgi:hypothetical protein